MTGAPFKNKLGLLAAKTLQLWGIPSLIVLCSGWVFWCAGRFEFVTLDDASHVYNNVRIQSPSIEEIFRFFLYPFQGLYIPVTYSAWAVQIALTKAIFGTGGKSLDPALFHWVNIVLHTANSLLVYAILNRVVASRWASLTGALVFALHPVQVEAVAWISALKDVLCGTFSLLGLLGVVSLQSQWMQFERDRLRYFLSSLCFVLALLSKPAAVMLPFMALVLLWLGRKRASKEVAFAIVPWIVLSLPFWVLTKLSQPDFIIEHLVPFAERPWIVMDTLVFYLSKIVFPFSLSLNYGRTPAVVLGGWWKPVLWVVPILLFLLIRKSSRRRYWLAGGLLFALYLLPVLGFVPFYYQKYSTVADRFLYLSLLGVSLIVGVYSATTQRRMAKLFLVAWILFLGVRSHSQLRYWKSQETLLTHIGEVNPDTDVFYSLGILHAERGRTALAESYYKKAISYNPRNAGAHNNLALLYFQQGDFHKAMGHMGKALEFAPYLADLHNNMGVTYLRLGETLKAKACFEKAIHLRPKTGDAYFNLGTLFEDQRKWQSAADHYRESVRLSPNNEQYRLRLKAMLAKLSRDSTRG